MEVKGKEGPCESRVCDGMMHVLPRSHMLPWKQSNGNGEDALSIKSEAFFLPGRRNEDVSVYVRTLPRTSISAGLTLQPAGDVHDTDSHRQSPADMGMLADVMVKLFILL